MIAYLAPPNLVDVLCKEIGEFTSVYDRLVFCENTPSQLPVWTQNIWLSPAFIPIQSISQGVDKLRSLQLRWANYPYQHHRRAQLIQQQLPKYQPKPLQFLGSIPNKPLGSWLMIEDNLILASTECSSRFPNGEIHFIENKTTPPSRAYLKLWELFTVYKIKPPENALCLDLGSSPGGWTWVLQQIGCRVISVDKAPLAPHIMSLPGVDFRACSAFSLTPEEIGPIDFLFSDVICYPSRLYQYIQRWIKSGLCRNFICTLKFQGETDFAIIQKFRDIEGSRLIHLYNNKHELTWVFVSRMV